VSVKNGTERGKRRGSFFPSWRPKDSNPDISRQQVREWPGRAKTEWRGSSGGSGGKTSGEGDPVISPSIVITGFRQCTVDDTTTTFDGPELLDGAETDFTLPSEPIDGSLLLYLNGQALPEGYGFTRAGAVITMDTAPDSSELLHVFYAEGDIG
jgi:hypothetical protein